MVRISASRWSEFGGMQYTSVCNPDFTVHRRGLLQYVLHLIKSVSMQPAQAFTDLIGVLTVCSFGQHRSEDLAWYETCHSAGDKH